MHFDLNADNCVLFDARIKKAGLFSAVNM